MSTDTMETGQQHSAFFAAVRKRGVLNTMLDQPAAAFERANPGFRARWEYCPASGDKTFIIAREGLGFKVVDASELGTTTASGQTEGPVRVGDLILMAAPNHIVDAIDMQDAKMAYDDWKVPQTTYEASIRGIRTRLKDGSVKETEPVGNIRVTQEVAQVVPSSLEGELEK